LNIDEIAANRGLTKTTIEGHLAHFIKTKEISLRDFVSQEKENKVLSAMKEESQMSAFFALLNGEVSYGEIRMVMASVE
jgi:uncharacterized protein YpbB